VNEVEGREQYHVVISNRFAALEHVGIDIEKLSERISKFQTEGNARRFFSISGVSS
jgi:hypothetical protein